MPLASPCGSDGTPPFQGGSTVDGFDVQTNSWDTARTWPNAPFSWIAGAVAKNPATDDTYIAARGNFAKWSPVTNSWTLITPLNPDRTPFYSPGTWEFRPTLVDPGRNRWCNFSEFRTMRCIDLTTYVLTTVPVTGALLSDRQFMVTDERRILRLLVGGSGSGQRSICDCARFERLLDQSRDRGVDVTRQCSFRNQRGPKSACIFQGTRGNRLFARFFFKYFVYANAVAARLALQFNCSVHRPGIWRPPVQQRPLALSTNRYFGGRR